MSRAERDEPLAPRRALAALRDAPDRVEMLIKRCADRDGCRPVPEACGTIRDLIARLGTLDRHFYLATLKGIREGKPDADVSEESALAAAGDLEGSELAELVARYRHVRAQSVAFLEEVPEELWRDGAFTSVVKGWIEHDAAALKGLAALQPDESRSQE